MTTNPTPAPPAPVRDDEMTPDLRTLSRLMTRMMAIRAALEKTDTRTARILLASGPCRGEFEINYRGYLRNVLTNGAIESEIARLKDGMDRAFTELAAGGLCQDAVECLKRKRTPSISMLTRPPLADTEPTEEVEIMYQSSTSRNIS